jgi:tetratricopeptide (TPR) repeat protein
MTANTPRPDYKTESYEMPIDEAIELARGHHLVGNFVLAERTYHDVLRAMPEHPTANHLLGALYFQLGNHEKAMHYMEESLKASPDEIIYLNNYGGVLSVAGHNGEAIEIFDKTLSIDPRNIDALNRKSHILWQQGDATAAEECARTSLQIAPKNLDGMINLGISLAKQKKYKESSDTWKEASEEHTKDIRVWSNWSNMLRELGTLGKAKLVADSAIKLVPENPEALNNLGCILKEMGQVQEAIDAFRQATNITPKYYEAHYNMALSYADLGQYNESAIAARYAVDFKPDYADGYNALSSALLEIGEFQQAHFAAQRAVQLEPDKAESYMNLADVLYLSNRCDDGHAALKEALKRDPDQSRSYYKLASIYERLEESQNAIEAIDKAIELAPEVPIYYARKAALLHVANEVDQSLVVIEKAIELAPNFILSYITKAEALIAVNRTDEAKKVIAHAMEIDPESSLPYFTYSNLTTFESEDDKIFQIMLGMQEKADKMGLSFSSSLNFAIANAYEKMKLDDKAFTYYQEANKKRRLTLPYHVEQAPEAFAAIKKEYSKEHLASMEGKGCESKSPIFIVGMPRSGTTLTEQIISSHPDVYGAGELPDVSRARRPFGTLTQENAKEMGELYVELSRARQKGGDFKHVSDKMPGNYNNIGLITSILPNAKIIHCCRNPMDTALSNFKQNFMSGQYWSYDLDEMADEFLRYQDMMAYWHEVLPGRVLDINYEDTVTDLETQARKMIDFIGLEWNDACLAPHKKKRAVLTASKMQVTQPVYKTSVEKWKRFEKQLQPLVRKLRPDEALPVEE